MSKPRVLVTRSPHQASALADALRAVGLEPVLIPTIQLAPPASYRPLYSAIARLDTFHWLLFTSANAVEAFFSRFGGRRIPETLKLAVIGPATAAALDVFNVKVALIPPEAIAESFAASLLPHALQPDGTPTRFLLVRAETARDHLPDTLRAAGAEVIIVPAYRTIVPDSSISAIQAVFADPAQYPQAITFTSSSSATNLLALLEASDLSLPPDIFRISIGAVTSKTLTDLNLPPHAQAEKPSIASLVEKVVSVLGGQTKAL